MVADKIDNADKLGTHSMVEKIGKAVMFFSQAALFVLWLTATRETDL